MVVKRMEKREKGFLLAAMLLTLLFLAAAPAVSRGSEASGSGKEAVVRVFPAGSTVVSLRKALVPAGLGYTLAVLGPDGETRAREVHSGDRAQIRDGSGRTVAEFTIEIQGEPMPPESSAAPPSSSAAPSSPSANSSSSPPADPSSSPPSDSSSSASSGFPPPASSAVSQPEQSGTPSSGGEEPPADRFVFFRAPVTVEDLKKELYAPGQYKPEERAVSVLTAAGAARKSGSVCTGDVIRVLDDTGRVLSASTAAVAGDLTRCGAPTPQACGLLYDYLSRIAGLREDQAAAADLDRDGHIGTADLLNLKKSLADDAGH